MGKLKLNIDSLARMRMIPQLHGFLVENGISKHVATELRAGRVHKIDLDVLLKLCIAFKCPVEDLILFEPSDSGELAEHPYLEGMVKKEDYASVVRKLGNLDSKKLKLLEEFLREI